MNRFCFFVLALLLFQPINIKSQRKIQRNKIINSTSVLNAREIANKVLPSVVLIITQDENGNPISQGSGFVIGQGLVVSNLHVFERATNATVKNVRTGEVSKAVEVVGMNAKEDICVIRIDSTKFPVLTLGNSSLVQTGDEIYVASNPKGLEGSFTKGIVSGLRNDVGLFQIDAAISPGSSGGVLLNQKAEAVGIIKSSLVSGQNLNFAIPINKLKTLPYKFKNSIQLAGACAYRDKEKEKLKGLVKSVTEKSRYRTIENGKLIETEPLVNGIKIFDLEGNKIEDHFYSVKGEFMIKFIYTFDENRLVTFQKTMYGSGTVKDLPFNLEQSINFKLATRGFSVLDINELLNDVSKITGSNANEQKDLQAFDANGNMTTWYIKGTKYVYEYDSEGRAKAKTQLRDGKIEINTRYRYKDDKYGNWIERYEYVNFPSASNVDPDEWNEGETTYREITYYE